MHNCISKRGTFSSTASTSWEQGPFSLVEKMLHFWILINFQLLPFPSPDNLHLIASLSAASPPLNIAEPCSLWFLRGFAMWLYWSVMLPEQNSRLGQPVTSHRQSPSQTSHNKQLSVATLCLWSEAEAEIRSVSFFLSSLLPFLSFSSWHLLISLFPLLLSRCIKWGDYSSSIGLHLKVQSVKRAFLSFHLLSLPSPHLLYSPLSFPFILSIPFTPFKMVPRTFECEIEQAIPLIYLNSSTPPRLSPSVHLSQPIVYLAIRLIMLSHLCN